MSSNSRNVILLRFSLILLFLAVFGLLSVDVLAQKSRPKAATSLSEATATQQTSFSDYKGVRIGMTVDEVRAKLGQPAQRVDNLDFYVVSQTESAQIFYDTALKVAAISIDYVGDNSGAPDYKTVVGTDVQAKPDGSMYKLVRYEQLGFWVSYNRTASVVPIITVTIQKFQWSR